MKWDYLVINCYFQEKSREHKDDHWALNINSQHYRLGEGMRFLGGQGWELVAVQQRWRGAAEYEPLPSWYIFKKQLSDN